MPFLINNKSLIDTGAKLDRAGGQGFFCTFSNIGKKSPNFGNKCPDYDHPWVTFLKCGFKSFPEKELKLVVYYGAPWCTL